MSTTHTRMTTPVGELTLVAQDGVLSGVYFPGHWTKPDPATFGERADHGFEDVQLGKQQPRTQDEMDGRSPVIAVLARPVASGWIGTQVGTHAIHCPPER